MSVGKKIAAYGLLGAIALGVGWFWAWKFKPHLRGHHVYPKDRPD